MSMITPDNNMQIVVRSVHAAEVRLNTDSGAVGIGQVGCTDGRWYWQHRDGERSSAIAANRSDAASALAIYHCAFKPQTPTAPIRRLLFGSAGGNA